MGTDQRAARQPSSLYAAVILGIVLVGFARTFYLRGLFQAEALPPYLALHGVVLSAWFLLYFVQVVLVARHRVDIHKRLGMAAALLVPLIVVTSLVTVAVPAARVLDQDPQAGFGNVSSVVGFAILVGAGMWFRRRPAFHGRLMLLGSIQITAPAIDRIAQIPPVRTVLDPVLPDALGPTQIAFAVLGMLALLATVFVSDIRSRGRPHLATVLGTLCIFLVGPAVTAALFASGAWASFVRLVT